VSELQEFNKDRKGNATGIEESIVVQKEKNLYEGQRRIEFRKQAL